MAGRTYDRMNLDGIYGLVKMDRIYRIKQDLRVGGNGQDLQDNTGYYLVNPVLSCKSCPFYFILSILFYLVNPVYCAASSAFAFQVADILA